MTPRDKRLLVVSVLLGPQVGLLLFALAGSIGYGRQYGLSEGWGAAAMLISVLPLAMIGAYVYGLLPALIGALAMALLSRWFSRHRLWLAAPVGAVSTLPTMAMMTGAYAGNQAAMMVVMAVIAAIGAISACVCTVLADRRSNKDSPETQN